MGEFIQILFVNFSLEVTLQKDKQLFVLLFMILDVLHAL
jgi:hypothetical protein